MPDENRNPPSPPGAPPPSLPSTLDQTALERVLARAAELQAGSFDTSSGMSESQLFEVAGEVGIGPEHIRQALAEERTRVRVPEEHGFIGELFGGTITTASRIVRGSPAAILAQLEQWMQREEGLRLKRRYSDRLTWEARRDLVGSIQKSFNLGGRAYALTSADEVGASAVAIDGDRTVVRMDASFSHARRRSVGWSGVVAGLALAGSAGLLEIASLMPGGSLLVAAVTGGVWTFSGGIVAISVARAHRRRLERGQLALEQVLDRLEHGELRKPGNALSSLIDVVSKTVEGGR